jgi:hypothetical protein
VRNRPVVHRSQLGGINSDPVAEIRNLWNTELAFGTFSIKADWTEGPPTPAVGELNDQTNWCCKPKCRRIILAQTDEEMA